jgi:hypothetical protein
MPQAGTGLRWGMPGGMHAWGELSGALGAWGVWGELSGAWGELSGAWGELSDPPR